VDTSRRHGWRLDRLVAYPEGKETRFVVISLENREKLDWHCQAEMTPEEFARALAERKKAGMFPLNITSYGDDDHVRYGAVWVRYRAPEQSTTKAAP
jgi:hypothetical protein